jgi:hypothetical protein
LKPDPESEIGDREVEGSAAADGARISVGAAVVSSAVDADSVSLPLSAIEVLAGMFSSAVFEDDDGFEVVAELGVDAGSVDVVRAGSVVELLVGELLAVVRGVNFEM